MIVLPDQRNKLQWDAGISMVCVLVAVLSPYRMAFAPIDARRWLAFDAIVDICFVIGEKKTHTHTRLDEAWGIVRLPSYLRSYTQNNPSIVGSPFSTCGTFRESRSTARPGRGYRWVDLVNGLSDYQGA